MSSSEDSDDDDAKDNRTALMSSVSMGKLETTRRLLREGADVDERGATGMDALMIAVQDDNHRTMNMLLDAGANPNGCSLYMTPLSLAAHSSSGKTCRILLKHRALPNTRDPSGHTPIERAGLRTKNDGRDDVVDALLAFGVDLEARDRGFTVLMTSASRGHLGMTRRVLDAGADVHAAHLERRAHETQGSDTDVGGSTAFDFACIEGHVKVARLLLKRGARPHPRTLSYAISCGQSGAARFLLDSCPDVVAAINQLHYEIRPLDPGKPFKMSALMLAASSTGDASLVACLLQHKADPSLPMDADARSTCCYTAVQVAACHDNPACVRVLLKAKADMQESAGNPALVIAVRKGHLSSVKILLDHGANVDAGRDQEVCGLQFTMTPLIAALGQGNDQMARYLLEQKADVLQRNGSYWPAIATATHSSGINILARIIEAKADVNELSAGVQVTALHRAALDGLFDKAALLLAHGANVNQHGMYGDCCLRKACEKLTCTDEIDCHNCDNGEEDAEAHHRQEALVKPEALIRLLVAHGADVNSCGLGEVPLVLLASAGHIELVRLLLKHNADPALVGEDKTSALQAAASYGHRSVVKLLQRAQGMDSSELDVLVSMMPRKTQAMLWNRRCAGCGVLRRFREAKFKKCSRCATVSYCSKECQIDHWKQHRATCMRALEVD